MSRETRDEGIDDILKPYRMVTMQIRAALWECQQRDRVLLQSEGLCPTIQQPNQQRSTPAINSR